MCPGSIFEQRSSDLNNKGRKAATTSGGGFRLVFIFDTDLIGSSVISNSKLRYIQALSAVFKDDPHTH
ncbi:CFC_HP_G0057280.mRNA.1.CDS.1 [Saccharomyces cerevisiae]|nr:CFC_HP_G0057280.mRNA.1.CDS.1 [Saccharomyces cerevisiae]CAI6541195.1 CFC_HP_G0057280.mRNA.1.CDS.1 [Saccharomyces cerevisiae]